MKFELDPLPYAISALEPHISRQTLEYHYGKHHQGYMNKLRDALEGTPDADRSLEDLIVTPPSQGVFNLAAQVWNHSFYWLSMTPSGGGQPPETVAEALAQSFGSLQAFHDAFSKAAGSLFGSGWTWLIKNADGQLSIRNTSNAENPLTDGLTPLLTLDVWEHAYYLDHQNDRGSYIETFMSRLINWQFVESNL